MGRLLSKTILVPITVLLFLSPAFGQALYRLPQVADGANLIRTTFIFINNGDTDATVTMNLTDDDGEPMDIAIPGLNPGATKVFTLAARQSRFFTSEGTGAELKVGAGQVLSTSEIGVAAVFSLFGSGGTALLTEAGIGASPAVSEFAIAVDTKAPFNTGVAVQNLGLQETTLTFKLYDKNGVQQGSAATETVPGRGHLAKFVAQNGGLFPGAVNFEGRMVVTSGTTQVSALTLRQNAASGSPLTTMPAVPTLSDTTSFNLSNVANGFGGGIGIKTQFIFFSLGPAATAQLSLTNDAGGAFPVDLSNGESGSQFELAVPAGGAVFVETDGEGAITTGAARVTSDNPIGVTAVFSLLNAQGAVTVEAGVGNSALGTAFSLPVDLTGGFNTGVAVSNPNGEASLVSFTYLNADGTKVDSKSIEIPGSGHISVFVRSAELFPGLADGRGQLNLSSDLPIAALSLRQQLTTANLTTLPVLAGVPDPGTDPEPNAANLLRKTIDGLSFLEDRDLDVRLEAGYKLSGRIQQSLFSLPVGQVQAFSPSGEVFAAVPTGSTLQGFSYSMVVPKGTYDVRVCTIDGSTLIGIGGNGTAPPGLQAVEEEDTIRATFVTGLARNVLVVGDTTKNVTVAGPTYRTVSGNVTNLGELPVDPDTQTIFLALGSEGSTTQAFTTIDSTGAFELKVAAGTYRAGVVFGEGEDTDGDGIVDDFDKLTILWDVGTITVGTQNLTGIALPLPDLASVSGKVLQPGTADMSQAQVLAFDLAFPDASTLTQCVPIAGTGASLAQATAGGDYSLTVIRNETYDVLGAVPVTSTGGILSAPLPGSDRRTFSLETNTLDRPVPAAPATVAISGRVTGPSGAAVAGASVSATTIGGVLGAPNATFVADTETDQNGNYTLEVLSGFNYILEVDPAPAGSGIPTQQ